MKREENFLTSCSVILLAGGRGERMGGEGPTKQFRLHKGKPLVLHSVEIFLQIDAVKEIIIVCAAEFQDLLLPAFLLNQTCPFRWALPGRRRQDSVSNGLRQVSAESEWVCVHDAARPFVSVEMIESLLKGATDSVATALAYPLSSTIRSWHPETAASRVIERSCLWEMQTPQLVKKEILEKGCAYAEQQGLTVTDDLALAELLGYPVKLVAASRRNHKITTPDDLYLLDLSD